MLMQEKLDIYSKQLFDAVFPPSADKMLYRIKD
jgi:hypothetical protein